MAGVCAGREVRPDLARPAAVHYAPLPAPRPPTASPGSGGKVPSMLPRRAPRVLLALFLLSLASVARPVAAQDAPGAPRVATAGASGNPFDAEVRRLQADITRLGRSPRAVLTSTATRRTSILGTLWVNDASMMLNL